MNAERHSFTAHAPLRFLVYLENPNSEMLKTQTLTTLGILFAGIIMDRYFWSFYFVKIAFKDRFYVL